MSSNFQFKKKLYYMRKEEQEFNYELDKRDAKKLTMDQAKPQDFEIKMLDDPNSQAAGKMTESVLIYYKDNYYEEKEEEIEDKNGKNISYSTSKLTIFKLLSQRILFLKFV